jgi:hypothetical protein
MKRLLSVAAGIAAIAAPVVVVVSREASAVEDPPQSHYQLLEAESMAPVLESYAGVTAGTATVSVGRRQSNTGGLAFSGQAAMVFDNHNGDGSRMTLPFEVEAPDSYLVSASLVKGPTYGVVQVSIDGRRLGAPVDGYAAALARPAAVALGGLELSKGKHTVSLQVTGKNDAATDYLAALDFLELDSDLAPAPTPAAVADVPAGGTVDATLALTVGAPPSFGAFQPGVAKDYTATTLASVISTAGDATLSVSDPGHLANGAFTLPQPLQVTGVPKTWSAPVSNEAVTIGFKQAIGAADALRTGSYTRTLTFTLSTTNP